MKTKSKGPRMETQAMSESGTRAPMFRGVGILLVIGIVFVGVAVARTLTTGDSGSPSVGVSPAFVAQLWYKATPVPVQIFVSDLSGGSGSPVAGYQYSLKWDPTVLQWLSGPAEGPGTPAPTPACQGGQLITTWGTATSTPVGFVPTYTFTPTQTPLTTTPTNTPTIPPTATRTPTPGGYIKVACASLPGGPTPVPSTVVGNFLFQPIATGPSGSPLTLIPTYVAFVDANGAAISGSVSQQGFVSLPACNDVDGSGVVTILDLSLVASRFQTSAPAPPAPTPTPGGPNGTYDPRYDVNHDGQINIIDLALVAVS